MTLWSESATMALPVLSSLSLFKWQSERASAVCYRMTPDIKKGVGQTDPSGAYYETMTGPYWVANTIGGVKMRSLLRKKMMDNSNGKSARN